MSMLMTAGEHTKSHQVANQIDNGNDDGDNDNGGEHDNYEGRTPKGGSTINETKMHITSHHITLNQPAPHHM